MTTRKKTIITLIVLVFILTFLRETGVLNVNYYKLNSTATSNFDWSDKTITVTIDSSMMGTKFQNGLFSELPVIVLSGSDTVYKDTNNRSPIIITIDKLNTGFLWTPLYKSTNFSAVGVADFHNGIVKTNGSKINLLKSNLSGHLTINGHISITGLCSHRHAIGLIKDIVAKKFTTETKRHFSTLD
jgi:hypothetical protein